MSVYKEGFSILASIRNNEGRVFNDACDLGTPYKMGDRVWNGIKMLVENYMDEDSSKMLSRTSKSFNITLVDEWAVMDEIKTIRDATEKYKITCTSLRNYKNHPSLSGHFKDALGYVEVERIN